MKILKHGITVIAENGHVTFTDFTVDLEGEAPNFTVMARVALDAAYQLALVALGETIILGAAASDTVQ